MKDSGRLRISGRQALRVGLVVLFLSWVAAPVFAQQASLEVDPAKTTVAYTLHDVLHTVHGTFRLKRGSIGFDPAGGAASGSIAVDAASGESGNHGRDSRMHREILESQKYPEIAFVPEEVQGTLAASGDSHVDVRGMFRLHGEEHEITVPAQVHINGDELLSEMKFDIQYVKWGVKNPSTFVLRVSDTVQIEIHAVGHVMWPGAN